VRKKCLSDLSGFFESQTPGFDLQNLHCLRFRVLSPSKIFYRGFWKRIWIFQMQNFKLWGNTLPKKVDLRGFFYKLISLFWNWRKNSDIFLNLLQKRIHVFLKTSNNVLKKDWESCSRPSIFFFSFKVIKVSDRLKVFFLNGLKPF